MSIDPMSQNGVIVVNKPQGPTSHDIVAAVKRLTGQKAGHTGTLDPNADGVLPVCIGAATKLADYMSGSDKTYIVEVIFGKETDTQDETGIVLSEAPMTADINELKTATDAFLGDYNQLPPMYSALKSKGKKLYELARAGKTVERQPRTVYIHDITLVSADLPRQAVISVTCSKGAYMRTLCHDLGIALGSFAHMGRLTRRVTGGFSLENAYSLDELRDLHDQHRLSEAVVPMEKIPALEGFPKRSVRPESQKRFRSGGILRSNDFTEPIDLLPGRKLLIIDQSSQQLRAIYESTDNLELRPATMLITTPVVS